MGCESAVPVVATGDVARAIAFFVEALGFRREWSFGAPLECAGVKRDEAEIYICHDPELAATLEGGERSQDIFVWVHGIDELCRDHQRRGVRFLVPLQEKPWKVRQYAVEGPGGYTLKFAEPLRS